MIVEIADFLVQPGTAEDFVRALEKGVATLISKAKGFRRFEIQHGIESPERIVLILEWDTLENHTVDFRGSPAFLQWRELIGPFFARPPQVEHFHRLCGSRAAS